MKIDTRGSDLPIILGARESIEKFHPYIIFEYNRDNWNYSGSKWEEAKRFFDQSNYLLYFIDQKGTRPVGENPIFTTSHNILGIPKTKLSQIKFL